MTFMTGPAQHVIELFHGYTFSAHPLACAAALATQDIYREEGLYERAAELSDYWADAAHSLQSEDTVIDVRNLGLVAGIELESRKDAPGTRAYDVFVRCFEAGVLIRVTGDIIALSPPLIVEKSHIDRIFETLGTELRAAA